MEKTVCIYCIESKINNKKYIGQTTDFSARKRSHISDLRNNKHKNTYLQHSWNKYGEDNFDFYIIKECSESELDELERYYISYFNTMDSCFGFNRESGGNAKKKASDKTKKLISEHHADVAGEKNPMYGKKQSEESISQTVNHPNYITRRHRGEDSHTCKISQNIAYEIKKHFADGHELYSGEVTDIADKYGISKTIVSHIKNGYSWAWLEVCNA